MTLRYINPKHYYTEFIKFKNYLVHPVPIDPATNNISHNIAGTWTLFVIKVVLTIFVGVLVALLYDPVNQTKANWLEVYTTGTIFLLSMILLPSLEEIAFRLSLRFKPMHFAITLGVLAYYVVTKGIYHTKLSALHTHFDVRILVAVLTMLLSYSILEFNKKVQGRLKRFWEKRFPWVFYLFCITFAFLHILNYELTLKHIVLIPIITLPKFVSALTYGYVRMQYGFIYALGLHMFWNSFAFIQIIYFSGAGTY